MTNHLTEEEQKWAEASMDNTKKWLVPSLRAAADRLSGALARYYDLLAEYSDRMVEVSEVRSGRLLKIASLQDEISRLEARYVGNRDDCGHLKCFTRAPGTGTIAEGCEVCEADDERNKLEAVRELCELGEPIGFDPKYELAQNVLALLNAV